MKLVTFQLIYIKQMLGLPFRLAGSRLRFDLAMFLRSLYRLSYLSIRHYPVQSSGTCTSSNNSRFVLWETSSTGWLFTFIYPNRGSARSAVSMNTWISGLKTLNNILRKRDLSVQCRFWILPVTWIDVTNGFAKIQQEYEKICNYTTRFRVSQYTY